MTNRRPILSLLLLTLSIAPAVARAQALGSEFQVSTYTSNKEYNNKVAAVGTDGSFVVVWESYGSATNGYNNILGQRYASSGSAIGGTFSVSSSPYYYQYVPQVAALGTSGSFVVVWQNEYGSPYGDDSDSGTIQGRLFASNGSPIGTDFQVNSLTTGDQTDPAVTAIGTAGSFVVVWNTSSGPSGYLWARLFGSDGTGVGADFLVSSGSGGTQRDPAVAAVGSTGDFVVTWADNNGYINARRFASDGTPAAGDFQVSSFGHSSYTDNYTPAVSAVGTAGEFVVAWASYHSYGGGAGAQLAGNSVNIDSAAKSCLCGSLASIQAQRYSSDGSANGGNFQVNTYSSGYPYNPSVSSNGNGFVVTWDNNASPGTDTSSRSVQGRRFASDGSGIGSDFQVNTYTTGSQELPSVAVLGTTGKFVVTWDGYAPGNGTAVFGKILKPVAVTVTAPGAPNNRWGVTSRQRIRWEYAAGQASAFEVDLSRDGGSTFTTLATGVPPSTTTAGNYFYTVPNDGALKAESSQIAVHAGAFDDPTSTGKSVVFSIELLPIIVVKQPWQASLPHGIPFTVTWNQNVGYRSRMMIELSRDGGSTWSSITSLTYSGWINRGTFVWTPTLGWPPTPTLGCDPVLHCVIHVNWLDGVGEAFSNPFDIS